MLVAEIIFLARKPKAQIIKAKINKGDYIKLKASFTAKETINKIKMWIMKWKKTFLNYISETGLIFKIHKEFIKYNNLK